MTSSKRIAERERGLIARQLTENPVWVAAWDAKRAQLLATLLGTNPGDADTLRVLVASLQIMQGIRDDIERHIRTGSLADEELRNRR